MSPFILYFFMITTLTLLLALMGQTLPIRKSDTKKMTPYECGFDPMKSSRLPFSFRFFLVAILFLMFDLEMALLLPLPFSVLLFKPKKMISLTTFLLMLMMGLYFEWVKGGLEWAKQ